MPICSEKGFTLVRDAQGFCVESGTWGHCMLIAGLRFDRPGACMVQSWGPDVPTGPTVLGQPPFSFWADRNTIAAMLAEGDTWAIRDTPSFIPPLADGMDLWNGGMMLTFLVVINLAVTLWIFWSGLRLPTTRCRTWANNSTRPGSTWPKA